MIKAPTQQNVQSKDSDQGFRLAVNVAQVMKSTTTPVVVGNSFQALEQSEVLVEEGGTTHEINYEIRVSGGERG